MECWQRGAQPRRHFRAWEEGESVVVMTANARDWADGNLQMSDDLRYDHQSTDHCMIIVKSGFAAVTLTTWRMRTGPECDMTDVERDGG